MTAIYHITHLRNLANILRDGGLWCDRESTERKLAQVSIAHHHIKERRARRRVPCAPGGVLADYVPFYFAPRSPMLFTIQRGNVEGYHEGQAPILHLVSSVEAVQSAGIPFAFSDGHADMDLSRFFNDPHYLDQIDWQVMRSRYWNDTQADGDRKRRRQAEFLVQRFFPFSLIEGIGVFDSLMLERVTALLKEQPVEPPVQIRAAWYY